MACPEARLRRLRLPWVSSQVEHRAQREVDAPLLLGCEVANEVTQLSVIHGPGLLDEHPRGGLPDLNLRTKGSGSSRPRRWGNEDGRKRQEGVGLHDHTEADALLLVSFALPESQTEDFTTAHAGPPSCR